MDALSVLVRAGVSHAAFCRADWRRLLRADFDRFEPDLEAVAGVVTDSYPEPDGAVRYDLRQHGKGWLGMHQDGSPDTEDSPWLRLSREDVMMWRLNAAGCALAEKLAGGCVNVAAGDEARDEVYGNFSLIKVGIRKIDLAKKYKARAFLRFARGYLKGEDKTFYVEELRAKFNRQFGERFAKRQWTSERFREDLFKGVDKEDFDALFETVDQASGIYRLMI